MKTDHRRRPTGGERLAPRIVIRRGEEARVLEGEALSRWLAPGASTGPALAAGGASLVAVDGVLETLTAPFGALLAARLRDLLAPEGRLAVRTVDLAAAAAGLADPADSLSRRYSEDFGDETLADRLNGLMRRGGRRCLYDRETLALALRGVGLRAEGQAGGGDAFGPWNWPEPAFIEVFRSSGGGLQHKLWRGSALLDDWEMRWDLHHLGGGAFWTGRDPQLVWTRLPFAPRLLRFAYEARTQAPVLGQVFVSGPDRKHFSEDETVTYEVAPDAGVRHYAVDVGRLSEVLSRPVDKLRWDPVSRQGWIRVVEVECVA